MEHRFGTGDTVRVLTGYNAGFVGTLGPWNPRGYWPVLRPRVTVWARGHNFVLVEARQKKVTATNQNV